MPRSVLLSLMIWLVEILFVTALVSDEWCSVQLSEDAMVISFLEARKDAEVRRVARIGLKRSSCEPAYKKASGTFFSRTEAERLGSRGFEEVGRDNLFPFIAGRLQVLWDIVYQALRRFQLLIAWWPFLLAIVIPFAMDALV